MDYYLVPDTESGGLDSRKHKFLEIGASVYDENGTKVDEFHQLLPMDQVPGTVTMMALKINKYLSREEFAKQPAHDVAKSFAAWTVSVSEKYKPTLVGQNIGHDIKFINQFMEHFGYEGWSELFSYHVMDTCQLGLILKQVGLIKVERYSLKNLCEALGIELNNAHTAVADSNATAQVWFKGMKLLKDAVAKSLPNNT